MPKHKVYVDGKVHIRARSCETCIFTKNSPVSVERREEMVAACAKNDGVIPCHHHLYTGAPVEPVCSGFYRLGQNHILRLAEAMEVVEWVD